MAEEDKTHTCIATELCDYTIDQWLQQDEVKHLHEKDWSKKAARLVEGLLRGLDYMHTLAPRKILHRDLKVG